ncbi:MAG: 16S rRNA (uracil(1498)-N(3))-methyltransferase [Actinobacteria bacterium]|nr:16S rRNA (uracil(1498)-N(3))-methyltransferase [Actinomycetota bacterium]
MGALKHSGFSPRFFLDGEPTGATEATLSPEDAHHALRVLRLHLGDRCEVATRSGLVYSAVISAVDPVKVRLEEPLGGARAGASYRVPVGIVQALVRPQALDYVIEKGTEVGASFFLVVPADGSPRTRSSSQPGEQIKRLVRWQRTAREAAKQSKQTRVPSVDYASGIEEALVRLASDGIASVVLEPTAAMVLDEWVSLRFQSLPHKGGSGSSMASSWPGIALLVGPEGGWTQREADLFAEAGIDRARLGRAVLRSETAGPVALALTRLAIRDW